jgi:hypothetical protein
MTTIDCERATVDFPITGGWLFNSAPEQRYLLFGLAPDDNPTVTVIERGGIRQTVPVRANVYVVRARLPLRELLLRNAAGRMVRIPLS